MSFPAPPFSRLGHPSAALQVKKNDYYFYQIGLFQQKEGSVLIDGGRT
ncbi:MAG: hypothetical protein ACOY32_00460 [Thermodesulfobacteriota bacterium]